MADSNGEVKITAEISDTVPGDCDEDRSGEEAEHYPIAVHAGTSATCTIKLWSVDIEVQGDSVDEIFSNDTDYHSTFAETVTTEITVTGATPYGYVWESAFATDPDDALVLIPGTSNWEGKLIDKTIIGCLVYVENAIDPTQLETRTVTTVIDPQKRRDGWNIEVKENIETDKDWKSNDPLAFPGQSTNQRTAALGLNSNSNDDYRRGRAGASGVFEETEYDHLIVTPIYTDLNDEFTDAPDEFENVIEYVDDSGPNDVGGLDRFCYVSDKTLYKIDRITLINYWTTPNATKPQVSPFIDQNGNPILDPQGNSWTNWLEVQQNNLTSGDSCQCSNPSAHNVSNIHYQFIVQHESYGNPASQFQHLLGHQVLIEDAASNPLLSGTYDTVYRCDLLYGKGTTNVTPLEDLRNKAEDERLQSTVQLLTKASSVHSYITADYEKHNYHGNYYNFSSTGNWQTTSVTH